MFDHIGLADDTCAAGPLDAREVHTLFGRDALRRGRCADVAGRLSGRGWLSRWRRWARGGLGWGPRL